MKRVSLFAFLGVACLAGTALLGFSSEPPANGKVHNSKPAAASADGSAYGRLLTMAEGGDDWASYLVGYLHVYLDQNVAERYTGKTFVGMKREALFRFAHTDSRPAWCPEPAKQQFKLAQQVAKDVGMEGEAYRGLYWLSRAADQGNPRAMLELGYSYSRGDGVRKSWERAVGLWRQTLQSERASEIDRVQAGLGIASALRNGWGVAQDETLARKIVEDLAATGSTQAMLQMAAHYSVSAEQAFVWDSKAAALGDSSAFLNVGVAYLFGTGVAEDRDRAYEWLQKAADHGSGSAMYTIGQMHKKGWGYPKSTTAAFPWFERAWEMGYVEATVRIGYYHLYGYAPVNKSPEEAFDWFLLAAHEGFAGGWSSLGEMYDEGLVEAEPQSTALAIYCYLRAINSSFDNHRIYSDFSEGRLASLFKQPAPRTVAPSYQRTCHTCRGRGTTAFGSAAYGSARVRNACYMCAGTGRR